VLRRGQMDEDDLIKIKKVSNAQIANNTSPDV
jgi:hypothetical protein